MKKYKILGNHDYGEYVPWKTEQEKQANLQRLIKLQRDIDLMLCRLLLLKNFLAKPIDIH